MRAQTSLISIFAAGAATAFLLAGWNGGLAAPTPLIVLADRSPNAVPVDAELVIAVDVSPSMDPEEQALQREGYIIGLTSREFLSALRGGMHGKVSVTYFEWAALYDQKVIVPWRLIDGPESADAVANEIASAPYRRASRTSIYGALQFAKPLFDASGFNGIRRVIDVSGAVGEVRRRDRSNQCLVVQIRNCQRMYQALWQRQSHPDAGSRKEIELPFRHVVMMYRTIGQAESREIQWVTVKQAHGSILECREGMVASARRDLSTAWVPD